MKGRIPIGIVGVALVSTLLRAGSPPVAAGAPPWPPPDVPDKILQLVPESGRRQVFEGRWLEALPAMMRSGDWATTDPRTDCQCDALRYALGTFAALHSEQEFPKSLKDAREIPSMLWSLDALTEQRATLKQMRMLAAFHPPDPYTYPDSKILETAGFLRESHPATPDAQYPAGSVMITPFPVDAKGDHPFSHAIAVRCISKTPALMYPDDGGNPEVTGEALHLHLTFVYWPSSGTERQALVWYAFMGQMNDAMVAYVLANGRAPDSLDDLDSAFGERNKVNWTPEMQRLVDEYFIPKLKALLATAPTRDAGPTLQKPLTRVPLIPAGITLGASYGQIVQALGNRNLDFREFRDPRYPGTSIFITMKGTIPGTHRKDSYRVSLDLTRDQLRVYDLQLPALSDSEWQGVFDFWAERISKVLGKAELAAWRGPPFIWDPPGDARLQLTVERPKGYVTLQVSRKRGAE